VELIRNWKKESRTLDQHAKDKKSIQYNIVKTSYPGARQSHVFGEQKPLNRSLQKFACWVLSTTSSCWWRSVKRFWRGEGSNFGLFHNPLTCFVATVRACDYYKQWLIYRIFLERVTLETRRELTAVFYAFVN